MKILVYGINYSPELTGIGKYTGEMVEWMASQGHDVRVITAPPYYPEWKVGERYSSWRYRREEGAATVWRCPLYVPKQPSTLKRLIHLGSFALSSFFPLMAQRRWKPDRIIGVVPTLFAWLIGLPVLKLKSDYLAIATLGFAEIMRAIIQWNKVGPLTNSSNLLRQFANFDSVLFPFIVSGICIAIIVLIINSTYGRAFKAIRDDEVAAEAMGINLAKHKMQAFLISSFFAGISGALLAMFQASIQANAFTSTMTYEILLIVVIGGIGSVTGSILGSFLYIACSEWWLRFLDDPMPYLGVNIPFMRGGFRMLVFSVIIMIVVLFFRKGIMGDREFSWDAIINFFGKLFKKKDKAAKEVASK